MQLEFIPCFVDPRKDCSNICPMQQVSRKFVLALAQIESPNIIAHALRDNHYDIEQDIPRFVEHIRTIEEVFTAMRIDPNSAMTRCKILTDAALSQT